MLLSTPHRSNDQAGVGALVDVGGPTPKLAVLDHLLIDEPAVYLLHVLFLSMTSWISADGTRYTARRSRWPGYKYIRRRVSLVLI